MCPDEHIGPQFARSPFSRSASSAVPCEPMSGQTKPVGGVSSGRARSSVRLDIVGAQVSVSRLCVSIRLLAETGKWLEWLPKLMPLRLSNGAKLMSDW